MDNCKDINSRQGVFLQQLVEQVVSRNENRVAVQFGDQQLTYQQLNDRADALARAILHTDPDADWIGVSTTRNLEMIIGVLAILKAGKAYLPLDPAYPDIRLQQIIADSALKTCLATAAEQTKFDDIGLQVIESDGMPEFSAQLAARQGSTAYVLYTSGSTGKPKGVCMGHGPLVNLLQWQSKQSKADTGSRTLQLAPLSFDVSFQEIFATLSTGGTLVLISETLRLDLNALLQFIDEQAINRLFLPFVALQYLSEVAVSTHRFPINLMEVMTAGEQLKITPQVAAFFTALPQCTLFNQYGPTECHVVTQLILSGNPALWPALPTIGHPIDGVKLVVVDEALKPLAEGQVGELCFSGFCLAEGYLNQPELTDEKFIELPFSAGSLSRAYRTGDLGRILPDGNIEFLGRRDDQVKIRGHRVELGEVEVIIGQLPWVSQAVVVALDGADGYKQLVAYVVTVPGTRPQADFRNQIDRKLPEYMRPSVFVWLDDLPKTSSGKVDRKRLPKPQRNRPELSVSYRKPRTATEQVIARIWGDLLQLDTVGVDDNFFELGGNSLLAQKTASALQERQYTLPVIKLYQYPTIAALAKYLAPQPPEARGRLTSAAEKDQSDRTGSVSQNTDIAIIGMAGRFPGANTVTELWNNVKVGKETTRFFADNELDPSIPASLRNDPLYVKARGVIEEVDQFDAHFFGLSPKVAQLMDPQQRVFLEIAWETLEQTGYLPQQYAGRVGVFAGCGNNTYYQNNIPGHKDLIDQVGSFQVMTLNEKDYIASRTAYQLNLKGPAVSVYSACSTSLLAIAQAVQSLRSGQCEVALAGGASITTPVNSGHLYQEGAMLSQDGHCRSFDADAQGTVFSDGAGVVLLKSREAAERDGDIIYALIKGVGVNNDGGGKGSFTAPSAEGQAGAVAMAIADAHVDPSTIGYVEAHGTATPLGDPIEIDGLTQAFGEQVKKQYCAVGSIKSNMGHMTQAAGVAGFIKATLALHHKQIPPSINFSRPNPAIDFENSPFYVNTRLLDWETEPIRRAGVSSFGVGGTNVHVVLESFDSVVPENGGARPIQLVTWSAKSADSLEAYAKRLVRFSDDLSSTDLPDAAFTLQTTRADFLYRQFVVAATPAELRAKLLAEKGKPSPPRVDSPPDETAFLFPGQGAQYLNMGRGLYEHEAVFRQAIDTCADLLLPHLDADIRQVMYPETADSEAEQRLKNTRYTQPAMFVTEYALASLWMSWGITPSLFCGHSIGEFVAAHLAGVFSLPDALTLIAARGKLVSGLPRGSMLSVRLGAEQVTSLLPASLSVAAINSHKLCVVAGPDEYIADFSRLLDEQGIPNQPLATSHAFHSAMMDPIVADFERLARGVALNRPQKPIISTVTGTWMTDTQATDPHYWATHLRETVRFADALDTVFSVGQPLLLEVGPGHAMATLARQQAGKKPVTILAGLPDLPDWETSCQSILTTLGQLYQRGLEPDWAGFYAGQQRRKIAVPTYAFNRKRCWLDPVIPTLPWPAITVADQPAHSSATTDEPANERGRLVQTNTPDTMRREKLIHNVNRLLEEASGIAMDGAAPDTSFLELGLDSLLLTQVALTLKKEFGVPVTFRQLTSEYTSPGQLADYLDQVLPAESPKPRQPVPVPAVTPAMPASPITYQAAPSINPTLDLIAQQMQLLARQIELLQAGNQPASVAVAPATSPVASQPVIPQNSTNGHIPADTPDLTPEEKIELKKPFGATARIDRQGSALSTKQQDFIQELTDRYNQKTGKSKAYAQKHRAHMADPRVVSGFRPYTKELVYPLVVNRSAGSHLWDIDGNEYIDALNGFGSNMFGYQPDWLKETLHAQIELGFEVGPQHELAGEVSELICELTGADRAALCNTGSEAVMGAMRIARTVTGRSLIVAFSGSYHGIADEVLVRGTKKRKSYPAAPGIMPEAVQNILILDYGTDESLQIIRERAHELAAVLVEPVQSRRPEFVPVEFLKAVRSVTEKAGTVLIFDEVITGFRTHPGGVQALFGIKADLATYGKVVGAGIPIGVISGKRAFMDALDGGFWQYGDESVPEVGVTYFAGTFVRHPLALAAAKASLTYMKESGPQLQQSLTDKTTRLASEMNTILAGWKLPIKVVHFGSLWKIKFNEEVVYGELLFTLMRDKGIHIWDGFPCFLTEAHTRGEVDTLIAQFRESVQQLINADFFGKIHSGDPQVSENGSDFARNTAPPGARLGRDLNGNPAWFVPNPSVPGKYLQVKLN